MQPWKLGNTTFNWGERTYLMGVLNVTPDSFSDGGEFNSLNNAIIQAVTMVNAGVDIIDIGGESTRPGSAAVEQMEELHRVVPAIVAIRQHPEIRHIPISIDTTKAAVARAAVAAGADVINDISGATFDPEMLATIAKLRVPAILMHIRGNPKNMQQLTDYDDLLGEIIGFLQARIDAAVAAGCDRGQISIDPGIGFAKDFEQNLELLRRLTEFKPLDCPMLIGVSRKSFIGHILNQPEAKQRVWGTAAACVAAIANGADILRVHDVAEIRDVAKVADAIYRPDQIRNNRPA
ncbi:dihydropteroate synthase [filamentous cyanobacterium LEGE 11480]|uniref:Dihydropteroate synthase n=1 Tax=Romeriopsis navalis LEGE 11480 TaxID=2777977 RepID=A0A928Z4F1_9CYAN|nr:dihydropteroate synthase [Romeriopsis navalis]MBE9030962.1 dihydropteroate synthase [Romeriopsis navalis LEGE 11480]